MFMEERQQEIARLIEERGKVLIMDITSRYDISAESARRDLRMLEQAGVCKRTHGGAIRLPQVSVRPPLDRDFEKMPIYDNYREIARRAAGYIHKNDSVYLTGGSLGYLMLEYLPREFTYTVVVNAVDIAQKMRAFDKLEVYVAGGKMRQSGSLVDSLASDFVRRMHFDLCFITGGGITAEFGLSNGTDETAAFQRSVLKNSRKKILLMPGAKVGLDSFIKVCGAEEFGTVITDWDCVEEEINKLEELGCEVIVVERVQHPGAETSPADIGEISKP